MKKRKRGRIFSRKQGPRKALMFSIMAALAQKEKVQTSTARAKEVSPLFEKLITKSKSDSLATRRELARYFGPRVVKKIMEDIGPRYKERNGGYTRITKLAPRKSDGASMAIIELV